MNLRAGVREITERWGTDFFGVADLSDAPEIPSDTFDCMAKRMKAGMAIAARIAMIATTIINSTSEKPFSSLSLIIVQSPLDWLSDSPFPHH